MKFRFVIIIGTLLFVSQVTVAQYKPVVIGLTFNPGVSWIKPETNHYETDGSSFSYAYGVDIDFFFSANYAFSTGLQIHNYGGKVKYPDLYSASGNGDDLENVTTTSTYSYMAFHLPTYLKLKTNPIGYNSFFAEFGFSWMFPFKASQERSSVNDSQEEIDRGSENNLDQSNFATINLLMGAGIEFPISGDSKFQIAFRFLNGITSLSNANSYKTDENGKVASDEIANGGNPTGEKESYYLKNLSLNFKFIF